MTKPLAIIHYERLMPGSQLTHRLTDLGYRVQTVPEAPDLLETARRDKPMIIIVDLAVKKANMCEVIQGLRSETETEHVPIIGFAPAKDQKLHAEAMRCGRDARGL